MKDRDKYYGCAEIKELGFTAKLMEKYLPDADKTVQNPYNRHAPIRYWLKIKIDALIEEPPIREKINDVLKHRQARSASAQKAVETKREKIRKRVLWVCDNYLELTRDIPLDEVRELALEYKEEWYIYNNIYNTAYNADQDTIDRWTVNFIRHKMMNYDYCLNILKGEGYKDLSYDILREYAFNLIKRAYPELTEECDRQMQRPRYL